MKENKDVTIQRLLDEKRLEAENIGNVLADDADFEAYSILYDNLNQKPAQGLSYSFNSSVVKRIELEKKLADDTKFYWLLSIISLVGIGVITAMFYGLKDSLMPLFAILTKFKGVILIITIAIILSNILEKRILKITTTSNSQ